MFTNRCATQDDFVFTLTRFMCTLRLDGTTNSLLLRAFHKPFARWTDQITISLRLRHEFYLKYRVVIAWSFLAILQLANKRITCRRRNQHVA
ncbi:hypothetical protein PoB_005153300 [Plakobranchus ocellatus]|uniref:Uncharacterized protein n=1 Tax=Plakobranchus ocellatus TaxID=259542 RepID=A0AAV4BZH7_9GAST|nr:hypothetical protein PoB_005153300 [Plakobranchus ocellatus]